MPQLKLNWQCHLRDNIMFVHLAQGAEGLCPKLPEWKHHQSRTHSQNHHGNNRANQVQRKNLDRHAEHGERSESDQLTHTTGHVSIYGMYSECSGSVVQLKHD